MLETMKFAALIHPAVGAGILSSERILEMATIDGARALGLDDEVGSLEAGKKADVMVIGRRGKPHLSPGLKPVSDVVSCANGSDVDTVVVGDGCGDESNALDSRVASVDDRIVRRVVILLALIALALVVTVTITLRGRNAPTANVVSVQLPASGNAVATFLPDGRPVFVVTSRGGVTSVVDGVSTHRPYGVGYLIGWCPSSQTFDDPYHGSRWSSDGRYLLGPAPADLPTYTYRTLDGRVTIDPNPTAPTTRSTTRPRIAGPNCPPKDLVEPTFASGAWSSPANAVAGGDGWVDVLGELRVTRDGAELCDPSGSCPNAVPVPGVKGNVFRETGRWLARIEGHDITDLTALP